MNLNGVRVVVTAPSVFTAVIMDQFRSLCYSRNNERVRLQRGECG
jgi:hypothetical protein